MERFGAGSRGMAWNDWERIGRACPESDGSGAGFCLTLGMRVVCGGGCGEVGRLSPEPDWNGLVLSDSGDGGGLVEGTAGEAFPGIGQEWAYFV